MDCYICRAPLFYDADTHAVDIKCVNSHTWYAPVVADGKPKEGPRFNLRERTAPAR